MRRSFLALTFLALCAFACKVERVPVVELAHFPLDSLEGLVARDGVSLDSEVTSDGRGSLRFDSHGSRTVRLFETGDLDVENARLTYQAKLRTQDFDGQVYLEMWCQFAGQGEFFSRALHAPLSGSNEWSTQETPFFLKAGENPSNVKLNLVLDGKGTAWIDEVRLIQGPLR